MFQGPGLGRGAKLGSGGGFEGVFSLGTGPLVVGVHSTGSLIRANLCECHWLSPYSAPLATSWDRSRKRRGGVGGSTHWVPISVGAVSHSWHQSVLFLFRNCEVLISSPLSNFGRLSTEEDPLCKLGLHSRFTHQSLCISHRCTMA